MKQARKLDVYFEYEEKIMSKTTLDKSLLDIISDPDGMYHEFEVNVSFTSDESSIFNLSKIWIESLFFSQSLLLMR